MSNTRKNSYSEMYQSLLERAESQALEKGQEMSDVLAFPVVEIIDQQNNRVRQYQTLEFKVIKELKTHNMALQLLLNKHYWILS